MKKSSGDVTKITKPTKRQQEEFTEKNGYPMPNNFVEVNCYMIPEKEITDNPNLTGDYNVARYLNNFNKRMEPLLCVFKPEIRDDILSTDINTLTPVEALMKLNEIKKLLGK